MLKKINIIIVMFFLPMSLKINFGYLLILPILLFYLIKDSQNIIYISIPSLISTIIFNKENFINYLIILIISLIAYYIINHFIRRKEKILSLYDLVIIGYMLIIHSIEKFIFNVGPINMIGLIIGIIISTLIYVYLQQYLSKLTSEIYENNNHISTSLCYLDILIAIVTLISAASTSIFNINLGFIVGVYFAMYTGRSYKNIYSIFYSLCAMLILLIGFDIKESLFIPFIGALYFISNIYLMIILNVFLTILLFTNQTYSTNYIISIMSVSIIFEIISYFLIKDPPTDKDIFENIHDQIQKNTSNEILNFATFLDKFAVGFRNPKEFNEQLSNGIKTIVQTHCKNCNKTKECFNKHKVDLYPIFKTILLGENAKEEYSHFYNPYY